MFREIILPIFRSTRLCVTACGLMHPWCCRPVAGRQLRGCIIPQAVTHNLVLLKMGKIIARNRLNWLELLISRAGRQHRGCIIPQTVTHSLALLKTGKIIARNMLSWLELLISRYCCIYLVSYIIYINDATSSKYQIMKYICWLNI
jgi:hypothetical protein